MHRRGGVAYRRTAMVFRRHRLLPILLALLQVALWPGLQSLSDTRPDGRSTAIVLVATALATVGLGLRRTVPLVCLVAVTVVYSAGQLQVGSDEALIVVGMFEPI